MGMDALTLRRFCLLLVVLTMPLLMADEPEFLALLEADAELETAFPGEVIENLWRQAELRTRRCRSEASDPAWLQRVEALAEDSAEALAVETAGREYILEGALDNLREAGLDPALVEAFTQRSELIDERVIDFGSCRGFVSTLQRIYDQPQVGSGTPAVVGTVCGQVEMLTECHGQMAEAAARLPR
jgi:hypothetical protein